MKKTKQFVSGEKPLRENREVGLLIKCLNCNTGRVFKITENLKLILSRNMEKFKIEIFCEECNKKIEVSIGWINDQQGFSYKDFNEGEDVKTLIVEDENGLGELE